MQNFWRQRKSCKNVTCVKNLMIISGTGLLYARRKHSFISRPPCRNLLSHFPLTLSYNPQSHYWESETLPMWEFPFIFKIPFFPLPIVSEVFQFYIAAKWFVRASSANFESLLPRVGKQKISKYLCCIVSFKSNKSKYQFFEFVSELWWNLHTTCKISNYAYRDES